MSITIGIGHSSCNNNNCPCKFIIENYSIWTCALEGNYKMLERKICENIRLVKLSDSYGYLPLHYAAQGGHIEIVKLLIQNGSPIDGLESPFGCGATPLHRCAFHGHLKICQILVEAGANINAQDYSFGDNRTPLMKAMSQNQRDVVNYLLSKGADINIIDSHGLSFQDLQNNYENNSNNILDEMKDIELKDDNQESKIITNTNTNISTQLNGIICSECSKETLAVVKKKDSYICMNCNKKKLNVLS